ncbi:MAG: pilus assembly PilX N-terminal domain-containing protein [Acidobacteria bacterium]|nr:pilus assembly PilX N-terminal domain-containing protein [Acidobacteriota bacterium]
MTNKQLLNQQPARRNRERGIALIIALLAMGVLTSVGFALMLSSSTETLIHANFRSSERAFYASRGGLEEIRGRMGPDALPAIQIPAPADTNTATYILNGAIDPSQDGCTFTTPVGNINCEDPQRALTLTRNFVPTVQDAGQVPYVWTKAVVATQRKLNRNLVTPGVLAGLDDAIWVCFDGENLMLAPVGLPQCVPDFAPVYILTTLSIDQGGARRFIRQVASYGMLPPLTGPLTLDGPNPTFNGPSSAPSFISGVDAGAQGDSGPAIGTINNGDANAIGNSIPKQKQDDYPGDGGAGPPADIQNVSGDLHDLYSDCAGLISIVNTLTETADYFQTGPVSSLPDPGSVGNPIINVVDGDANLSSSDLPGAGILLVTGDLTFNGYPTWDGIIFVIGNGRLRVTGAGNGTITGGIFIANTTTCPAALGSPEFTTSGGGTMQLQYNTDLTEPPGGYMRLKLLSLNY